MIPSVSLVNLTGRAMRLGNKIVDAGRPAARIKDDRVVNLPDAGDEPRAIYFVTQQVLDHWSLRYRRDVFAFSPEGSLLWPCGDVPIAGLGVCPQSASQPHLAELDSRAMHTPAGGAA